MRGLLTVSAALCLVSCVSDGKRTRLIVALESDEARAHGEDGADSFVEAAELAFASRYPDARLLAAHALGRLRPSLAVDLLAARLVEEEDERARRAVVDALTWIGGPRAASVLRGVVEATGDPLRAAAVRGLGDGEHDAVRAALDDSDAEVRLGAALVLVRRPEIDVDVDALRRRLDAREDERVRWVAAQAVAARPGVVGELVELLAARVLDRNFLVGFHAVRALRGLPSAAGPDAPGLEEILSLARDAKRPWIARLAAIRSLESWLRRSSTGDGVSRGAARREVVEAALVEQAISIVESPVPGRASPVLLMRAVQSALEATTGTRAGVWKRRLAASRPARAEPLLPSDTVSDGVEAGERGYPYVSPYVDPPLRGPRMLLEVDGGEPIVLELFPRSAPHRISILRELVRRGAFEPARLVPDEAAIGILVGPSRAAPAIQRYAPGVEPSSRRILTGTLVEPPGARASGRFLIALRPIPEWEGRVAVLGRVLLGSRRLVELGVAPVRIVEP